MGPNLRVRKKAPCVFLVVGDATNDAYAPDDSAPFMRRKFPVSFNGYRKATVLMDALRKKGRVLDISMYCPDSAGDSIPLFYCGQDGQCAPWGFDHALNQKRTSREWARSSKTARIPLAGIPKKKKRK